MNAYDGGIHYHIRWSEKAALDWACFDTRAEAEKSARQLVLPDETYTIEEYGATCPQCMKLRKHMPASDTSGEMSR
jgi:hypothetical protein